MRWSKAFIPTIKEDPAEAEMKSHQLMLRSGMIRQLTAGVYEYLPLGWRVFLKVMQIIREEMNRAGGQELFLPALAPAEIWQESGRWDDFGDEMFRVKDRKKRDYALCPTHEEIITDLARAKLRSYRDLPQNWYQMQVKFRDEPRPRSGVLRVRHFIMKDAYSMDRDQAGLDVSYQAMYDAYHRIFSRCGIKFFVVGASSGLMGGSGSQEFMVASPSGEDSCAVCPACGYAANLEVAQSKITSPAYPDAQLSEVPTPEKRTVEEVCGFLKVSASQLVKSLLYMADGQPVFALVRGDDELNESKLQTALGSGNFRPATPEEVLKITKANVGFISPVGINDIKILADLALQGAQGMVSGANKDHHHLSGIDLARDVKVEKYADLRMVKAEEPCIKCGQPLVVTQAIELGHVFKLGTKYSQALKANFVDEDGSEKPLVMGSYGIGIERVAACIIEQSHDQSGIIWPLSVAPYQVVISQLGGPGTESAKVAENLYNELQDARFEVLLDDREERPGFKFKDADLTGIPIRINVGEKSLREGLVEIKQRKDGQVFKVRPEEVRRKIQELTSVEMWPLKQQ
ncbi:MAG: proline--tRNA ligase [Candidatus Edwardsbacteria bacterium]|nr:proline--tRNA ligase [Candidatus Edwardsbacteria bacterium]MBU1576796.1 proline--tRNA ligase [Candidatus Edwardsbacteria bacterium]MBU2463887.1 proline--tRNA ligase [Candidatus Edwardsbacteria bacterium]MBU2593347.1 proline--tRNA ligase [Candidatus Edwardsbacteria bacterium]